jgi:hypothetical protein
VCEAPKASEQYLTAPLGEANVIAEHRVVAMDPAIDAVLGLGAELEWIAQAMPRLQIIVTLIHFRRGTVTSAGWHPAACELIAFSRYRPGARPRRK